MADAVSQYIDLENEINNAVDKLIDAKKDVISVIEQLEATEYDLIHKVYVQYLSFYDVAEAYDKTYTWVTTIHGRALKNVQEILNRRTG